MSHTDDSVLERPRQHTQSAETPTPLYGVVAEFESPEDLIEAIGELRDRGYRKLEAYTPFPVHGLDEVLGIEKSRLGFVVMAAGLIGAAAALLLQWWTGAVGYPLVIGGKPFFAVEFSIPVTFEITVLFAAFAAVGGMFLLNGLPRFYHPVFQHESFARVSDDRFLLAIEAEAPDFDAHKAVRALESAGGLNIEVVTE